VKDIHDIITHAKFGDDRLRGSEVVAGQISAFPIDFAGRFYNSLTLPCKRVICIFTRLYGIYRRLHERTMALIYFFRIVSLRELPNVYSIMAWSCVF